MKFSESKTLDLLGDDWVAICEETTEDAGMTYFYESVLYHRETRRHGFLWTQKRLEWVVRSRRFAGWLGMGSMHHRNVEYFRKLIQVGGA